MDARLGQLELEISPVQTQLAVGYKVAGLVGHEFLPVFRNPGRTFKVPIYGTESFELVDAKRPLRGDPKEVSFAISNEEETLTEYSIQSPMDQREEDAAAVAGISYADRATLTAKRTVAISREKDTSDLLTDTTTYASGNSKTVTAKWDSDSNDPLDEIFAAKEVIRGKIGLEPNFCLMGQLAWNSFKRNALIVAAVPGGTGADQTVKSVRKSQALELMEMENLFIGAGSYHTGSAFADIWGDVCILAYCNPNPTETEEPSFGYTVTQVFGMDADGLPLMGVAGGWVKSPFVDAAWYMENRLIWVALDTAGYLMLSVNT
jgi:hypothetical protein